MSASINYKLSVNVSLSVTVHVVMILGTEIVAERVPSTAYFWLPLVSPGSVRVVFVSPPTTFVFFMIFLQRHSVTVTVERGDGDVHTRSTRSERGRARALTARARSPSDVTHVVLSVTHVGIASGRCVSHTRHTTHRGQHGIERASRSRSRVRVSRVRVSRPLADGPSRHEGSVAAPFECTY